MTPFPPTTAARLRLLPRLRAARLPFGMRAAEPGPGAAHAPALALYDPNRGQPVPAGDFVLLVPGAAAPVVTPDLPAALGATARDQVARRQISDATGLPIGSLELRPLPARPRYGWSRAVLCDISQATLWRGQRDALGPHCRAILPDYLGLPAAEGLWVVQGVAATGTTTADMVLARLGVDDGFAAEPDLASLLLEKARTRPPRCVLRLGSGIPPVDATLATLGVPVVADAAALTRAGLPEARVLAHGELACDLGRDPAAETLLARRRMWRWMRAGLAGLLALALWSAAVLVQTGNLRRTTQALRTDTVAQAQAYFVPSGPILDVRQQVQSALRGMRAAVEARRQDRGALDLLRAAGLVMADHRVWPELATALPGGGLELTLGLPDFAALDRLVAALAGVGLAVQITEASARTARPGDAAGIELPSAPPADTGITAVLVLTPKEAP